MFSGRESVRNTTFTGKEVTVEPVATSELIRALQDFPDLTSGLWIKSATNG